MRSDVELPQRMRGLPVNKAGYVVPWFVAWVNGEPDFRVIRAGGISDALRFRQCWLCGHRLGKYATFVVGPMCAVNRVSAEPPSHKDCSEYAVKVCPFLTRPNMVRRENNLPEGHAMPAGHMIARNPGATVVWTSSTWSAFRAGDGVLFDIGDPNNVAWYREGRKATRDEVLESMTSGLPLLAKMAGEEGPHAVAELDRQYQRALTYVPAA